MNLTQEELWWIGSGIFFMALELLIPGMVSVFLGVSAVCVGLMIHFQWISGIAQTYGSFFGLSILLMLTVRQLAARFFLSDEEYKYTEEDSDAAGKVVEVTETIHSKDIKGRIRFQGTEWPAHSLQGTLKKGSKAVIKHRDNISWVVEPLNEKSQKK